MARSSREGKDDLVATIGRRSVRSPLYAGEREAEGRGSRTFDRWIVRNKASGTFRAELAIENINLST